MTFPRLSRRIIVLSAALVPLLTTITCTKHHLKVIRRDRFGEIENFYRTIRDRNNKQYNQPLEDINLGMKNIVCLDVFSSGFFVAQQKEPMNMEDEVDINKLKTLDPKLAKQIYPRRYTNPTVPTIVTVARQTVPKHDYLPEYVFVCPIWNGSTEKIEPIYVSEEYKLDGDISARFLFIMRKDKLALMGVAEEPAEIEAAFPDDFERAYIQKRGNGGPSPAMEEKDDPVCRHDEDRRIEICTSILSSKHFDGSLLYYPNPLTTEMPCRKWKIAFHLTGRTVPADNEEWMLLCDAIVLNKKSDDQSTNDDKEESTNAVEHKTYYVSRAYEGPGRALLFTLNERNNRMYLERLRISNVININE